MVYSAIIFCSFIIIGALFQLALALGVPWGKYAMGGKFPGKFPDKMRVAALVQIIVLLFFAIIVLIKAGIVLNHLYDFAKISIWVVVVFFVLGTIMNLITKSVWERRIWAPVNIILLISSLIIAIG